MTTFRQASLLEETQGAQIALHDLVGVRDEIIEIVGDVNETAGQRVRDPCGELDHELTGGGGLDVVLRRPRCELWNPVAAGGRVGEIVEQPRAYEPGLMANANTL